MSRKARTRARRRDRRKAKASGWRRQGKVKCKVGHGPSGGMTVGAIIGPKLTFEEQVDALYRRVAPTLIR